MARRMIDIRCNGCGETRLDQYVDVERMDPHSCYGKWERVVLPGTRTGTVIPDDIPGGLIVKHLYPEPRKFYSRTDIRRAAKAAGVEWGHDRNEHVVNPKSDGDSDSADTRRWV